VISRQHPRTMNEEASDEYPYAKSFFPSVFVGLRFSCQGWKDRLAVIKSLEGRHLNYVISPLSIIITHHPLQSKGKGRAEPGRRGHGPRGHQMVLLVAAKEIIR
jgi:hypothetical protein